MITINPTKWFLFLKPLQKCHGKSPNRPFFHNRLPQRKSYILLCVMPNLLLLPPIQQVINFMSFLF